MGNIGGAGGAVPDPIVPADGTQNITGRLSVRASGGPTRSLQLGDVASANGTNTTAVGDNSTADDLNDTAVGNFCSATGSSSTGLGKTAAAPGLGGVAAGVFTVASGPGSTAVATAALGGGVGASAFGNGSCVPVDDGTGLGSLTVVLAPGGLASGNGATVLAGHTNSIADGTDSITTAPQRKTVGRVGGTPSQIIELQVSGGSSSFGAAPPATQPSAIADVPTGGSATAAANATAINAILAALRGEGSIAP